MEESAKALPPSRVLGTRVREFRTHRDGRRWTQERLAQELREVGIQIGQTDVARLEKVEKLPDDKGKDPRPVTVEDWLALAFVLDVPPLALLLPNDRERIAILPKGARPRDPERFEIPHAPPTPAKALSRTYSGPHRPVHVSHDRVKAWIVGAQPLDAQREPERYKSYGRQDAQISEAGLGAYLRWLAGLLDAEDLAGQRDVISLALQYLAGAYLAVVMTMERRQDAGSAAQQERRRDVMHQVLTLLMTIEDGQDAGSDTDQER